MILSQKNSRILDISSIWCAAVGFIVALAFHHKIDAKPENDYLSNYGWTLTALGANPHLLRSIIFDSAGSMLVKIAAVCTWLGIPILLIWSAVTKTAPGNGMTVPAYWMASLYLLFTCIILVVSSLHDEKQRLQFRDLAKKSKRRRKKK